MLGSSRGRREGRAVRDGDGGLSSSASLDSWLSVFMQDSLHGGRQRIDPGSRLRVLLHTALFGLSGSSGWGWVNEQNDSDVCTGNCII